MTLGFKSLAVFLAALLTTFNASGQSTTILNGSYVTKYGQFRNFVTNPDAQVNAASVTVANATATRSTTTPVSENGTTEFNVTITSANGTVDFLTSGATQAMLGGRQCAVGFVGRGFQSTSTIQAFDGTNVLGTYVFGTLTNTQLVELPFPCPLDPSTIRVRITDTATLAGTNEVAGVYFGRVRNIGDAANVTAWQNCSSGGVISGLVSKGFTRSQCRYRRVGDTMDWDFGGTTDTVASGGGGTILTVTIPDGLTVDTAKTSLVDQSVKGTTVFYQALTSAQYDPAATVFPNSSTSVAFVKPASATNYTAADFNHTRAVGIAFNVRGLPISNWPTASSAISPSTQNVWGSAQFSAGGATADVTAASWTTFNNAAYASANGTFLGSATGLSTGTCGTTNDLGVCISNLPAGQYRVTFTGIMTSTYTASLTQCIWSLFDGTSRSGNAQTIAGVSAVEDNISSLSGIFNYTSAQSNVSFRLQAVRASGGGNCRTVIDNTANADRRPNFIVERLDSRNQQPIYITSPVKAAGTGTAPLSTEIGYRLKSNLASNQTATSGLYITAGSTTVTQIGRYRVRGMCSSVSITGTITYTEAAIGVGTCSSLATESRNTVPNLTGGNFFQTGVTEQVVSGSTTFLTCCRIDGTSGGQWSTDSYVEYVLAPDR